MENNCIDAYHVKYWMKDSLVVEDEVEARVEDNRLAGNHAVPSNLEEVDSFTRA